MVNIGIDLIDEHPCPSPVWSVLFLATNPPLVFRCCETRGGFVARPKNNPKIFGAFGAENPIFERFRPNWDFLFFSLIHFFLKSVQKYHFRTFQTISWFSIFHFLKSQLKVSFLNVTDDLCFCFSSFSLFSAWNRCRNLFFSVFFLHFLMKLEPKT